MKIERDAPNVKMKKNYLNSMSEQIHRSIEINVAVVLNLNNGTGSELQGDYVNKVNEDL